MLKTRSPRPVPCAYQLLPSKLGRDALQLRKAVRVVDLGLLTRLVPQRSAGEHAVVPLASDQAADRLRWGRAQRLCADIRVLDVVPSYLRYRLWRAHACSDRDSGDRMVRQPPHCKQYARPVSCRSPSAKLPPPNGNSVKLKSGPIAKRLVRPAKSAFSLSSPSCQKAPTGPRAFGRWASGERNARIVVVDSEGVFDQFVTRQLIARQAARERRHLATSRDPRPKEVVRSRYEPRFLRLRSRRIDVPARRVPGPGRLAGPADEPAPEIRR